MSRPVHGGRERRRLVWFADVAVQGRRRVRLVLLSQIVLVLAAVLAFAAGPTGWVSWLLIAVIVLGAVSVCGIVVALIRARPGPAEHPGR